MLLDDRATLLFCGKKLFPRPSAFCDPGTRRGRKHAPHISEITKTMLLQHRKKMLRKSQLFPSFPWVTAAFKEPGTYRLLLSMTIFGDIDSSSHELIKG